MKRQQKAAVVNDLKHMMAESQAIFIVNYKGMDVPSLQILRKELRENGGSLRITKATLMRIAAGDVLDLNGFIKEFKDQIGLVFAKDDVPSIAKRLSVFSEKNEKLRIISGVYESKVLSPQDFDYLASLPSREVLLARLAGALLAPVSSLTRLLHLLIARLVFVLKQIEKKQQGR